MEELIYSDRDGDSTEVLLQVTMSSSYDVIVVQHSPVLLKSTPFEIVSSFSSLKLSKGVSCHVNGKLIDIPLRLDAVTGRVTFVKTYNRRSPSDSSDFSDDDLSQRSASREKKLPNRNKTEKEKLEHFKSEEAPKAFWQFAWLSRAKEETKPKVEIKIEPELEENELQSLEKINEEAYEGEESSKEPLFHLSLCGNYLKKKEKQSKEEIEKIFYEHRVEYKEFIKDPPAHLNDSNLVVRIDNSIYTWQLGIAILTCRFAYGKELSRTLIDDIIKNKFTKSKLMAYFSGASVTKLDIIEDNANASFNLNAATNSASNTNPNISSNSALNTASKEGSAKSKDVDQVVKYTKNPDSQILCKMGLNYGENKCKFILEIGTSIEEINFKIFLWYSTDKIVISDIDGTITKSDILGQILTNYVHEGVTKFYTEIERRGYKLMYLTARAKKQYEQTRRFLEGVVEIETKTELRGEEGVEGEKCRLPPGPLLMSPDGYMRSLQREVISCTPDHLKTKILATLNEVFPAGSRPMHAGFGNRETDNIAYLRMNIPAERIFCISEKSIIRNESERGFISNYKQMLEQIDTVFPILPPPEIQIYSPTKSENIAEQNLIEDVQLESTLSNSKQEELSPLDENKKIEFVLLNKIEEQKLKKEEIKNEKNVDFDLIILNKEERIKEETKIEKKENEKLDETEKITEKETCNLNLAYQNESLREIFTSCKEINNEKAFSNDNFSNKVEVHISETDELEESNSNNEHLKERTKSEMFTIEEIDQREEIEKITEKQETMSEGDKEIKIIDITYEKKEKHEI